MRVLKLSCDIRQMIKNKWNNLKVYGRHNYYTIKFLSILYYEILLLFI